MISDEKLLELYTAMVQCRVAAEHGMQSKSGSGTAPVAEAILAGVAVDLEHSDLLLHPILATSRRNGHRPIESLIHALASNGHGRAHRSPASVAPRGKPAADGDAALHYACQTAKVHKTKKRAAITVAFSDGAGTTSAAWKKSLQRASRHNLPVLFVAPLETVPGMRPNGNTSPKATTHGVPVIAVDGHDLVAVYRVASESIARARQRRGPTVIATALLDASPEKNVSTGKRRKRKDSESLQRIESHLKDQKLFRAGMRASIEDELRQKLLAATGKRSA